MKLQEVINVRVQSNDLPPSTGNTTLINAGNRIRKRVKVLKSWLKNNDQGCQQEKGYLEGGSKSRVYWHLGSLMAFEEILKIIDAELDGVQN